ncbi:hypothetical protein SASPL_100935 [Salvia splendens]|uniref:Nuclear control of ATPase protein 2 n=1 Tax=Salvia splendens TaxID=180675 RepID=A0A8X8YQ09_SALSN|nr:hypothetical protein SASPL_100935 [Salvia splendens]
MEVSSESDSPPPASNSFKALLAFYSNYLHNRLRAFYPLSAISVDSYLLRRIANLYGTTRRRSRKTCLPLPLPSVASITSLDRASTITSEGNRIFAVLDDIIDHTLRNLHIVQKNLLFWQSTAEFSNTRKAYFMICQRGPGAFIDGTRQMIHDSLADGAGFQKLYCSASSHISERISVLTSLRYSLATFLAKVYMEVDKSGENLVKDLENSLPSLLVAINEIFINLEASIGHFHAHRQTGSSVDGSYSIPLIFAQLPEVNQEGSQWTECVVKDAINLIYGNLQKLDSYLSVIVSKHRKPRKLTLYWMRYSCGALGISFCSLWLLRHSKLMGSPDIDNWIKEAKDSTLSFWNDHVEQPILAIRDELFETFRKRQKGVMEREEVQLTADSLHSSMPDPDLVHLQYASGELCSMLMLLAFSEQTAAKKFPENASDQEMLELVMVRYEKELMHPIQGLVGGELVRALLIQVQKLKLDIEEAMLELDQILRANEINFAILAALPAFFISLILAMLVRAWFKRCRTPELRGEDELLVFKEGYCLWNLKELRCSFRVAKIKDCLRQDIVDLAKPGLQTAHKLSIVLRMERVYDCLLPSAKRS